ncbi:MAG: hypothetical protein HN370_04545 [Phycisphaerales bacterium]|nr:hypothetical protein [Phycisphaerales bacterium]
MKKYTNDDFYKDGKFDVAAGKAAYFELMKSLNCPIYPQLQEKGGTLEIWAADFGLGDFVNCGMGGVFWMDDQKNHYFSHEIYLLPGQMIPEHGHVAAEGKPAKMEGWMVRYGSCYNFGDGDKGSLPVAEGLKKHADKGLRLPESQKKFISSPKVEYLTLGQIRHLGKATRRHFLMGGPEGVIVNEAANIHVGAGLEFTNPGVKM